MKKVGRPCATVMPREEKITVRFNTHEINSLTGYAARYGKSVSDVVRESLEIMSVIPNTAVA